MAYFLVLIQYLTTNEVNMFNNRIIQTQVNGKTVTATKLGAMKGLKHGLYLSKTLLPAIAAGLDGTLGAAGKTLSLESITLSLVSALEDDSKLFELVTDLFQGVSIDGKQINFDEYFSGNYGEFVSIFQLLLKENFESFFTGKDIQGVLVETLTKVLSTSFLEE